mgnify:CR=1 FL=1
MMDRYYPCCCPECGAECDFVFKNRFGYPVGCDRCVVPVPAYDYVMGRAWEAWEEVINDGNGV